MPKIDLEFYNVLSKPIEQASLFYAYYFLSEVKNIREFRRKLYEITNKLERAFDTYSIYTIATEVAECSNFLMIRDQRSSRATEDEIFQELSKANVNKQLAKHCSNIIKEISDGAKEIRMFDLENYNHIKTFCEWFEKNTSAFSRSNAFIVVAKTIFETETDNYTWLEEYGGKVWTSICDRMLTKHKNSILYVDSSWNIQHNFENWLNKVPKNENYIMLNKCYKLVGSRLTVFDPDEEILDHEVMLCLKNVLDWNLKGDYKKLYEIASIYDRSLLEHKELFYK